MSSALLFIFLGVCVFTDLKYRKVFNAVTAAAVASGMMAGVLASGFAGLGNSLLGLGAGFLFLFPFYLLGGIGAGDVKFTAAVGSIMGAKFVLFGGLYGALIGGIAALAVLAWQRRLVAAVKEIGVALYLLVTLKSPASLQFEKKKATYLPYTVFLSAGMFLRWLELSR